MDDTTTFRPGEHVIDLGLRRTARLSLSEVAVSFPNRIHMTPLDCNRFGFGKPGGGGIGFAIETGNRLSVRVSDQSAVHADRPEDGPLVLHYHRVFQTMVCCSSECVFDLRVPSLVRQHFGLGSSVAVACAVFYSMNKLYGEPFSTQEMRLLIGHNFVEEYQGLVTRGLETGVGTSTILRGGVSVVANELVELLNRPFPEGFSLLLVDPRTERPDTDKPESEAMLRRTFFLDASYRYIKAYDLLMDMLPALHHGDLKRLGDYIWDIQFSGTHLSMIQSYECRGRQIYDVLTVLREAGSEVCGLSSVGPAIYAICRRERKPEIVSALSAQCGNTVTVEEIVPDNKGVRGVGSE